MQTCKSLFLIGILGLLVFPVLASAQNILVNGNFETGDLTNWEVPGAIPVADVTVESPDNGTSFPGSNNAYMHNEAEGFGLTLKQSTAAGSAFAGTVYYSVDLKLIDAAAGGVLFIEIFAEQAGGGVIGTSGLQGPLWPWNEWVRFYGDFAAPAGTDFLTFQIMANTGANAGANCLANVDNVYLSQEQPPVATEEMSMGSIKALYR